MIALIHLPSLQLKPLKQHKTLLEHSLLILTHKPYNPPLQLLIQIRLIPLVPNQPFLHLIILRPELIQLFVHRHIIPFGFFRLESFVLLLPHPTLLYASLVFGFGDHLGMGGGVGDFAGGLGALDDLAGGGREEVCYGTEGGLLQDGRCYGSPDGDWGWL